MKLHRNICLKIKTDDKQLMEILEQTLLHCRELNQFLSVKAFELRCFSSMSLHHKVYAEARELFPSLNSNYICNGLRHVTAAYISAESNGHDIQNMFNFKQLRTKLNQRLFTIKQIPSTENNNTFILSISTISGRRKIELSVQNQYQQEMLNGSKVVAVELSYHRKKNVYYINLILEREIQMLSASNPVGVDVGMNQLVVASNGFKHGGGELLHHSRRYFNERRSRQKKGTPSALRGLKQSSDRERDFNRTYLHTVSRQFVSTLVRGEDYVVLEDLTGISTTKTKKKRKSRKSKSKRWNRRFHGWAFDTLQQMIESKCHSLGIKVQWVDPRQTSQRCPRCGHISAENRKTQACFRCTSCGYQDNADKVAARNLTELALEVWAPIVVPPPPSGKMRSERKTEATM